MSDGIACTCDRVECTYDRVEYTYDRVKSTYIEQSTPMMIEYSNTYNHQTESEGPVRSDSTYIKTLTKVFGWSRLTWHGVNVLTQMFICRTHIPPRTGLKNTKVSVGLG